ncbi:MAG: hypothetical protein AAF636_17175 [Pseudomonadota bacterium]
MAQMEFTMLSTDLRRDPRWRELARNPNARLVYLSFMTSSLVTYTGHFQIPLPVFSHDSMISQDMLIEGLIELNDVGMIRFNQSTEVVRIVGWFNERRTPENVNFLKCLIRIYEQEHLPRDEIMAGSIAELSLAVLKKSRKLKMSKTNPEASRSHRASYLGEMLGLLQRSLIEVSGLQDALREQFGRSDPRLKGYYDELAANLPELPRLRPTELNRGVLASANPSQKPDSDIGLEGSCKGYETLSQQSQSPSKTLCVESDQKNRNEKYESANGRPFLTTINSDLSVRARSA